jgi:KRAB domain-containing zinc finger protein
MFVRERGLRQHIATFHLQEQSYSCDQCAKRFGRKDSLVKHQSVHTGRRDLVCEFCSRAFSQSANLIKHRATVHMKVPRPHACRLCPGRYYSPGELAHHVRISHEGLKDYRCLVCGQLFGGRPIARRHVKRVHKVADPVKGEHFEKLPDPVVIVTTNAKAETGGGEVENSILIAS